MTSKKTKAPVKVAPKAKKAGAPKPAKASSPKSKAASAPKAKVLSKTTVAAKPAAKQAVKAAPAAKKPAPAKASIHSKPVASVKAVPTGKATIAAPAKKAVVPIKSAPAVKVPVPAKVALKAVLANAKLRTPVASAKSVAVLTPVKPAARTLVGKPVPRPVPKPVPPPPPPPPPKKPGKGLNASQAERMKQLLLDRRASLMDRKNNTELAAEDLGDTGGDSADRAAVSVDRDFMAESQARDAKMLQDIDEALGKISAGSYGICEECRCTIAIKRLEYLPNVAYCIECQEKLEEQGLYNDNSGGGPEDFRNVE